jgi:putative proteasome-type protease
MTYCVGILTREGLVMMADTRTNAGLDNISTFRKLHRFQREGDKVMIIASAGNLALTQSVLSLVQDGLSNPETDELETLLDQTSMFKAAQFLGRAIRSVYDTDGIYLEKHGAVFDISMLLGGQMRDGQMRLFMLYAAGNFIEATPDTPYLQIGEHKYGKPILDRAIEFETSIPDAFKIGLISMDSTMRSNIGVSMPLDVITSSRDSLDCQRDLRIKHDDTYFQELSANWSSALRAAYQSISTPPYE